VQRLLTEAGVRPSRRLGQNFVADPNMVRRIVRAAGVQPGDRVVEIGVGLGSLTVGLVAAGAHVLGLEVDARLAGVARRLTQAQADIRVIDAADADWAQLLNAHTWRLVSNLPYSVGTRILVDLLESAPQVLDFTVMLQREVGERLTAAPRTPAYGSVSVRVAYYCEASVAGRVPPSVFVPRPEVESVLVRLTRRPAPPVATDPTRLFAVVDAGFAARRKGLRAALSARWEPAAVDAALADSGIEPARRAQTLTLHEFATLAEALT
jgi:16S rRNA (adenine1518-N6/adenine1519-N6)-dimethyltransferase